MAPPALPARQKGSGISELGSGIPDLGSGIWDLGKKIFPRKKMFFSEQKNYFFYVENFYFREKIFCETFFSKIPMVAPPTIPRREESSYVEESCARYELSI